MNDRPYKLLYKKLIRRWDSERELFYDDILRVLQSTIDSCINSGTDIIRPHVLLLTGSNKTPSKQ